MDYDKKNLEIVGTLEFGENNDTLLVVLDTASDEILFFDEQIRTRDQTIMDCADAMIARYKILG